MNVFIKNFIGKGAMSDVIIDGKDVELVKQFFKDMNIEFINNKKLEKKSLLDG